MCGVLLHVQEAREARGPERDAPLRRDGASGEPDHRGGDGPEGQWAAQYLKCVCLDGVWI